MSGPIKLEKTLKPDEFLERISELSAPIQDVLEVPVAFSNGKAYIPTDTACPSLFGASVARSAVTFFEGNYKGKRTPRVALNVPGLFVEFSVTAADIRESFRANGINAVEHPFATAQQLHLRLGLARGFGDYPDRCYMQVNGIYAG